MNGGYIFIPWLATRDVEAVIVERVNRIYSKGDLHKVLIRELYEDQHRLVYTSCLIGVKFGTFNRQFLEWCKKIYETHECKAERDRSINGIDLLLNLKDEEIKQYVFQKRQEKDKGLGLKKTISAFS